MASILDALTVSDAGVIDDSRTSDLIKKVGKDTWNNMNLLEKAALIASPVPIVGDITGLASDAYMYATKPEERTAQNAILTLLGMAPFIPAASAVTKVGENSFEVMGREGPIKATIGERGKEIVGEAPQITDVKKRQERIANKELDVARTTFETPTVDLSKYSGHPIIYTMSDRTPSNDVVYGIDGVEFNKPLYLDGGDTYGMNKGLDDYVWANAEKAIKAITNKSDQLAEDAGGKETLLAKMIMAPSSVDFPTMAPAAHIRYADVTLNAKEKNLIEKMIKSGGMTKVDGKPAVPVPNFSFQKEDMDKYLGTLSGPQRKAINSVFDAVSMVSPQNKKRGLKELPTLTNEQMRAAITSPEHLHRGGNMDLTTISMLDGGIGPTNHYTYTHGGTGEVLGTVDRPITIFDAIGTSNPELVPRSTAQSLHPNDAYTLRLGVRNNILNDEVLKGMGY